MIHLFRCLVNGQTGELAPRDRPLRDTRAGPVDRGEAGAVSHISTNAKRTGSRGFEPEEDIPARSRWSLRGL